MDDSRTRLFGSQQRHDAIDTLLEGLEIGVHDQIVGCALKHPFVLLARLARPPVAARSLTGLERLQGAGHGDQVVTPAPERVSGGP
jgi:hypothetical protein